jgi:hypothetical protein
MTTLADDRLAQFMRRHDIPLTRDAWISLNWGADAPEPWTAEAEVQLPDELQDLSQVTDEDGPDDDDDEEDDELLLDAMDAWNEEDHPRKDDGKFGSGGASGAKESETSSAAAPSDKHAAKFKAIGAAPVKWGKTRKANAAIGAKILEDAGFKAMTENPSGNKSSSRFAAIGSPTNGILVNAASPFWGDPVGNAKKQFEAGYWASENPLAVLVHEAAHTIYDPPNNWIADSQKDVAEKVSRYARTNPKEFVSEVTAGLHTGKTYDDDVMSLYKLNTRNLHGGQDAAMDAWVEEDHPRGQPGNAGQFGSGGASSSKESDADKDDADKDDEAPARPAKGAPKRKPPVGSKTGDKHGLEHRLRVDAILTEGYKGEAPTPEQEWKMRDEIAAVIYDFMAVNPKDVPMRHEEPQEFTVGDQKYRSGGHYYPSKHEIAISDNNHPTYVGQLVAHELMHSKFQAVRNAYDAESARISGDNRGGDKWIMRASTGELWDEFKPDYPVHAALGPDGWGSADELRKDDGNTDYSREYWKAEGEGKGDTILAVNETLAEMASLDWDAALAPRLWYKNSKVYKRLYKAIHDSYPAVVAAAAEEKQAGGAFSKNMTTVSSDLREWGFDRVNPLHEKRRMLAVYGPRENLFYVDIDLANNTWTGTYGPNHTKMGGKGRDSLKKTFEDWKRGVTPDPI